MFRERGTFIFNLENRNVSENLSFHVLCMINAHL
jgi:hypothetical protein